MSPQQQQGKEKVTVNEPFHLTANQYAVIKELAKLEGESLGEWIRWCIGFGK